MNSSAESQPKSSRLAPVTAPVVTIDLDALAANYDHLAKLTGELPIAMVKADGYGLGVHQVTTRLWAEGCRRFFVARIDEGIELRSHLPEAEIGVLDGVVDGAAGVLADHDLIPAINDLGQLERWRTKASSLGRRLPTALHFDTGMHRLGIPATERRRLEAKPEWLAGLDVRHVMSHLACADEDAIRAVGGEIPGTSHSGDQLNAFSAVRHAFPQGRGSLANSAGIFLGPDFHFELSRPGIALYGGSPWGTEGPNPMSTVVTVAAPVLQVQSVEADEPVGYGASWRSPRPTRLATVPIGYADGYHRVASNSARVAVGELGESAPIVGRVSMDLTIVDVGHLPEGSVTPGTMVEVLGDRVPVDELAEAAGTISYEMLTALGRRYRRTYVTSSNA